MKLFDYLDTAGITDIDTYDTVYDSCITVSIDTEETPEDECDTFVHALCRLVEVEESESEYIECRWSVLIGKNINLFRDFAKRYWERKRDVISDDDDLTEEWLNQFQAYLSGYATEEDYDLILKEVIGKIGG